MQIVWGCMGNGYTVVMENSREVCMIYLKDHQDQISDDEYIDGYDLMYKSTGRLSSWAIK
jgi:hypothetical protein